VSTPEAVALTLGVLALAGALPAVALVGARLVVIPIAPLAGAVVTAASAVSCVGVSGSLLMWFGIWSAAAAGVSVVVLLGRPGLARRLARDVKRGVRPLVVVGALAVAAAVAWTLRSLQVPNIGFDTRAIWLIHARWFSQGHHFALAAMRNPFLVISHPGYPPLISSVMALGWRVSGTSSDRVAVVLTALLNACALLVAAWGIVEAARHGARRVHVDLRHRRRFIGVGIVIAVLTVLVAGGVLGTFETNGYADPLWSLAAVAVVVYGLILPPTAANLGVVAVMVGVAGLTKVEGTAVAIMLLVVIGLRSVLGRSPTSRQFVAALGAGVLALLIWPVLTVVVGVPTDASLSGRRQGSLQHRAATTFDAMVPHLHVVVLAALCGGAGFLALRHVRNRLGLGNDLWAWAALASAGVVLMGAYVFGPGNIELWLAT